LMWAQTVVLFKGLMNPGIVRQILEEIVWPN